MVGRSSGELRWSGFVSARYLFPIEPTELSVTVRQNGFRLRIGGLVEKRLSTTFGVIGGAGAGMDWIDSQPRTDNPRLQALSGGWDELAYVSGFVGALVVTPIGALLLVGECDYQLRNSQYDLAKADGTARPLLSPNRFQPGFSLYLRFE
jgi:hypothetical protein